MMSPLVVSRARPQALDPDETEEGHQNPKLDMLVKSPRLPRRPPGRAVKPEELVAPVFGEVQPPGVDCVTVLFKAPPATLDPPN